MVAVADGRMRVRICVDNVVYTRVCRERRSVPFLRPVVGGLVTLTGESIPTKGRTIVKVMGVAVQVVVSDALRHDILLGSDALSSLNAVIDCGEGSASLLGERVSCLGGGVEELTLGEVDLDRWVAEFPTVLSDRIGYTDGVKLSIDTGDQAPIRKRAYRIPLTRRKVVEREIDSTLGFSGDACTKERWVYPVLCRL